MPYLVVSKNGSNHMKIEGVFEEEMPAKFYVEKLQTQPVNKRFFIEHHEFKDWCPEISKFVLCGS